MKLKIFFSLLLWLLLNTICGWAQAPAEPVLLGDVSVQLSPDGGLEVQAPAYSARVGADGNLHSIRVGETELLDDKTSFSLGAFYYADEPKRLGKITLPAPSVVRASDGTFIAQYHFLPGEIRLSLSHNSEKGVLFYIVMSEAISVASNARTGELASIPVEERWPDVTLTAVSGAYMTLRGGDRIWGPWAQRQMLELGPLEPGQSRDVSLSFGIGPPPKPTPSQMLSIEAETVGNQQVLGAGKAAQLLITVENRGEALPEARLSVLLKGSQGEPVSELAQQVSLPAKKSAQSRFDVVLTEPGIYSAQMKISTRHRTLKQAQVTLAFRPEAIKPDLTVPTDFEAFWGSVVSEASQPTKGPAVFVEDTSFSSEQVKVWKVSFEGASGKRLSGWLCAPQRPGPNPAILQLPAYGRPKISPLLVLAGRGYLALSIEVVEEGVDTNFIARGLENNRTYAYRDIVINALRGLDLLLSRPEVDTQRVALSGASQGGGLALIIAGLRPEVAAVAADVPMLCDFSRSVKEGGWPYSEIALYIETNPHQKTQVMQTLSYYDVLNFAPRVQSPTLLSLGLRDTVCRPETIYAAYNYLGGRKQIKVYPEAGHEGGGSTHWIYKLEWLDSILKPMPNLPFVTNDENGESSELLASAG